MQVDSNRGFSLSFFHQISPVFKSEVFFLNKRKSKFSHFSSCSCTEFSCGFRVFLSNKSIICIYYSVIVVLGSVYIIYNLGQSALGVQRDIMESVFKTNADALGMGCSVL
jgi:hypothetical protein